MHATHELPDLQLLRLLDVLLRERNLTRAARSVGLSQPAMSRALERLRKTLGDPLFVRTPQGVVPTERALQIEQSVRDVLDQARALCTPRNLDPVTLKRTFVVGASDFVEADLIPSVVVRLAQQAPLVDLTLRPAGDGVWDQVTSGKLDLVIVPRTSLPDEAIVQHLFDEDFRCVVRKGHPDVRHRLSLAQFARLSHLVISPRGTPGGPVDSALEARGLTRRVAVRTSTFLSAPRIVAQTDLVLTGPRRVLEPLAPLFGLNVFAPPLPLSSFAVHQGWHARMQADPAHTWFRRLVFDAAQDLATSRSR